MIAIDWNLTAVWAQAISSTVVLFMIYKQIKQGNTQIVQNDSQERYRRSWEFVRFYREELRPEDIFLVECTRDLDPLSNGKDCPKFAEHMKHFFAPRVPLFSLLNQLVEHQEVDERLLYGYLEEDFNRFIEMGVTQFGSEEFVRQLSSRMKLLLTLWGTQVRASRLLYGAKSPNAVG